MPHIMRWGLQVTSSFYQLPTSYRFQPPLLSSCLPASSQASLLAAQRDALGSRALEALGAYGALLRLLLPPDYPMGAAHHRWAQVSPEDDSLEVGAQGMVSLHGRAAT